MADLRCCLRLVSGFLSAYYASSVGMRCLRSPEVYSGALDFLASSFACSISTTACPTFCILQYELLVIIPLRLCGIVRN